MTTTSNTLRPLIVAALAVLAMLVPAHAEPSGTWTKKANAVQGKWSIVTEDGKHYVQLDDSFKTKSGPDLKIFLSRDAASSLTGKNATKNSVQVAGLKKAKGAQRYALPASVDLKDFKAIMIHCEKYSKLWAVADLK